MAHRIVQSVRPADLVGRFGGDEFVVLLADVADRRVVEELVQRVLVAVRARYPCRGRASWCRRRSAWRWCLTTAACHRS